MQHPAGTSTGQAYHLLPYASLSGNSCSPPVETGPTPSKIFKHYQLTKRVHDPLLAAIWKNGTGFILSGCTWP